MEGNVKKIISQLINNLGISRNDRSFDEADSWYTVYKSGMRVIEVRLSNHRTDVNTWANRQYRSDVPSKRISIVFRDGNYNGQTLLNEPTSKHIIVEEYVYDLRDGSTMSDRQISTMTKAIRDIAINGQFSDPFQLAEYSEIQGKYIARNSLKDNQGNTVAATKWTIGADETNESKTMKYMKTNKRTITESQLRQIIAEAIKNSLGYPLNVHPYEVEDANEILEKINYLLHHSGRNRKRPVLTGILERFRDEIRREVLKVPTFYDDTSSNDDEVQPWEQDELDYIHGEGAYRSDY